MEGPGHHFSRGFQLTSTLHRIQDLLRDLLNLPALEVDFDTTARDVPGWDSLAHINIVVAVEQEFEIKFALAELQSLQNIGEMVELVESKI